MITASADGYNSAVCAIRVDDNETATLFVELPETAAEGRGLLSGQGAVILSAAPDEDVAVSLRSDDARVMVPENLVLPTGQTRAVFDVEIMNDTDTNDRQTVTVTAYVKGWTSGRDTIEITDDDRYSLTIELPLSAGEEDGTMAAAGTVWLSEPS
ncbi:MAG: hypothetical protein GY758_03510, partial [Fuerstiella sp.]|nr:hypothetical protein [Fuerstiella sp.]